MKITEETTKNVLRAISEIVDRATIKGSRKQYDFFADRLQVACTADNLLSAVNRYNNLLGGPVLSGQTTKCIMTAAAAADSGAILQWLREQPKMVISMVGLGKDELGPTIESFVQAYEAISTTSINVKKRRPFEIGIRATVEQALSHGDDKKAGNATLFRRAKIRTGAELPYYSANAVGGQMRDLLADHFLSRIGFALSGSKPIVQQWFYHLLYSGGIMVDGAIPKSFDRNLSGAAAGTVNTGGVLQLRNMIPFFSLLGGVGKFPLPGRLYINDLRPECVEWGNGDESIHGMMDWRFFTRRDDSEERVSKTQIKGDSALADNANTSMIVNIECLAEGGVLEGGIDLSNHITEIEQSALSRGLLLLQTAGTLGGKVRRGFGRVAIEYNTKVVLNPAVYDKYLSKHKDEIVDYLHAVDALVE